MSWLTKVTDLAGKAEEMLVRMDQNAGDVIQQTKAKAKSASTASINRDPQPSTAIIDQVGKAEPSHAHSDFVKPQRRQQPTSGYAPSTSVLPEQRDAHLISFLNQPEAEEADLNKSTFSNHSVTEAADLLLVNNLRSQLGAKDSQISVLKARISDLEKRCEDERAKAKKAVEAIKDKERSKEQQSLTPSVSAENLIKEKATLQGELSNTKKRLASLEEQMTTVNDQLRLAKFNLTENKKEFDEYKGKAQKILQTKERLIESLKAESGGGGEDTSNAVLLAQMEELRLERDLARADLESAQVQVYNVRAEADEAESAAREARTALSEARRRLEEERDAWQVNHSILREKADCARSEVEVARLEMEKDRTAWQRRLDEKEAELLHLREESRRTRGSPGMEEGARTTTMLLQKEEELREALREKQILAVKLERVLRSTKETAVHIGDASGGGAAGVTGGSPLHSAIQGNIVKALNILRGNRTARTYFVGYLAAIHVLLFFIILTYTPESHPENFSPANPASDRG